MQPSMNNAMNNAEKQGEKLASKAHNAIDRGVTELRNIGDTDLKAMANDFAGKAKDVAGDVYDGSVDFVKKYPVGTALSLAAIGFFCA